MLVVAAYGIILPQAVLDLPPTAASTSTPRCCRAGGAAPIHRAIEAGDAETGITIMQMDAGLDTGAMLLRRSIEILPDDTTASLHDRLARLGGEMIDALAQLPAGLAATEQPADGVTAPTRSTRPKRGSTGDSTQHVSSAWCGPSTPFPERSRRSGDRTIKIWRAHVASGAGEPGEILACDENGVLIACGQDALLCTELQSGRKAPAGKPVRSRQRTIARPAGRARAVTYRYIEAIESSCKAPI